MISFCFTPSVFTFLVLLMHEMCQRESRDLALANPWGRQRSSLLSNGYGSRCITRHPAEAAVAYSIRSHVKDAVTTGRQVSDCGHRFWQHCRSNDPASLRLSGGIGSFSLNPQDFLRCDAQ